MLTKAGKERFHLQRPGAPDCRLQKVEEGAKECNVGRLIHETFRILPREILSEMIVIDDGSSDNTGDEIKSLISIYPRLRYIRHRVRTGQSAAIRTGVLAARSPIIATMDGDGQNDPADIPKLIRRLGSPGYAGPALVAGIRARRHAKNSRRLASTLANMARQAILKDGCPEFGLRDQGFPTRSFSSPAVFHEYAPVQPGSRFSSTGRRSNLCPSMIVRGSPGNPNTQTLAGSSSGFTT